MIIEFIYLFIEFFRENSIRKGREKECFKGLLGKCIDGSSSGKQRLFLRSLVVKRKNEQGDGDSRIKEDGLKLLVV